MTKRTFEVEFFWKIREWVEVAATSPRQALRLAHTLRDSGEADTDDSYYEHLGTKVRELHNDGSNGRVWCEDVEPIEPDEEECEVIS